MKKKTGLVFFIFCTIILFSSTACNEDESFGSLEEEINYIADKYVKVGAVIGVIDKQQNKQIFTYGTKTLSENDPPDANTVFDIGSITKTFTATLYANMYLNNKITNDNVGFYLPQDKISMPTLNGTEITFLHLATHMSGIPRSPHEDGQIYPVPTGQDSDNPYYVYTADDIYNYLTNYCTLEFEPGTWWGYSNTAFGLLGHLLGIIDGSSYENLLTHDIFDELDMSNSSLFLNEQQMNNMALGYNASFQNMPFFTAKDILQGCGMIKSSLNDMFKYLEANLDLIETPLRDAMDFAHQEQMHQGSFGEQGLAWWILDLDDGQQITYMAGGTYGHKAYIGFNKSESTGVIVLLNYKSNDNAQIDMGVEILKAIHKY